MDWLRLSPDEWTAVRLSLRVSTWATVVSLPFGILVAHLLARREFPGKAVLNGLVHLPLILPPVVTGYLLLLTFGRRGPVGAFLEAAFRDRLRLPLDRRGARLRGDGVPADGAGDPPLDRGGRPPAGGCRRHARRQPALGVRNRHAALDPAGRRRRDDPDLRQGYGRVRGDDHLRLEHPRRDADAALGDLHLHPGARRRCRGDAPDAGLDRDRDGGADRIRGAGATGQPAHGPSNDAGGSGPAAARGASRSTSPSRAPAG